MELVVPGPEDEEESSGCESADGGEADETTVAEEEEPVREEAIRLRRGRSVDGLGVDRSSTRESARSFGSSLILQSR